MNPVKYILILCVLLSAPYCGYADDTAGQPAPPFRLYNTADGMSQTNVNAITQDKRGYLWLATARGLNRFDGQRFVQFSTRQGMRVNEQVSLFVDADGDIWAGDASGGATLIRDSQVRETFEAPDEANASVQSIAVIGDSLFRSISGQGLYKTDLSSGDTERVSLDIAPNKLFVKDGRLIFLQGERLYVWRPANDIGDAEKQGSYLSLSLGNENNLFALTDKGEIKAWLGSEFITTEFKIPANAAAFSVVKSDQVWYVFEDVLVTPERTRLSLPVGQVRDVFIDREDVIWLVGGNGLVRYLGARFQHFPLGPSAPSRIVFGGSEDINGTKWFATAGGLLARYPNGRLVAAFDELALPSGQAIAVEPYGNDHMLVSFPPNGLYLVPISLHSSAVQISQTEGWRVTEMTNDNKGVLWVLAENKGLLRYPDMDVSPSLIDLPNGGKPVSMSAVNEGGIVVAVSNVGIVRVTEDDTYVYPQTTLVDKQITHVIADSEDSIWFVTEDSGIYHLTDEGVSQIAKDTELSEQAVYFVEPLNQESLVLGAENGVYQFDLETGQLYHYGALDGFVGIDVNARATFWDRSKHLWIGSKLGATQMNTTLPMPTLPALAPYITHFTTDLRQIALGEDAVIPPNDRGLQVGFVAVSPKYPSRFEYSYRLLGVDESWSQPASMTSVRFATLSDGMYSFEVKARYKGQQWGESIRRPVIVKPHFWQTTLFIVVSVFALLMISVMSVQYRLNRIKKANHRLKTQVAERTEHLETEISERKRSEAALLDAQKASKAAHDELKILNQRLQAQALTDPLTMLPNRRAFEKSLSQSMEFWKRNQLPVAVLFLDLNGFKAVNDTYGHDAGDELIRKVGKRLADLARTSDYVARLGGDEFVVVANNCTTESACHLASRVSDAVSKPALLSLGKVNVSASIGIACCPEHATSASELMRKADLAMYFAKRDKKSVMARYDEVKKEV